LSRYRRSAVVVLLAVSVLVAGLDAPFAQSRGRVDPSARDILSYRLTADNLRRFTDVTRAMERLPPPLPEGARPDVAMPVVLSMAFAFNEPWRDAKVDETVMLIDRGHPVVARQRAGVATAVTDVSADNLASSERTGRRSMR
jgi:hypothetical protein